MKKSKGEKIELLYTNSKTGINTKLKKKEKAKITKMPNKGNIKINPENEIIIGVTRSKVEPKKPLGKNKLKKKKLQKSIPEKKVIKKSKKIKAKRNNLQEENKSNSPRLKKNKIKIKIIKWTSLSILFLCAIIIFMLSSVFNIKEIVVANNSKISSEEIISLSGITKGKNMFKITSKNVRENVKKNPYIENINMKRSLNGKITLDIIERVPTYILKFANAYVYTNNQGYMLEISSEPLNLPTITGFSTPAENIKVGNRLITEDLQKLDVLIKIMGDAKVKEIQNLITSIDISNNSDYTLTLSSELKIVHFGDNSNISEKVLWIKAILNQEKQAQGEIFLQNINKVYFREKV